ncbi:fibronectin type III domain-containing protein [Hymenobacter baengnokdamensis]|uniref:fibronectin type III domain-containing protein n=1 Tax=Hymenobacter baengnokdamensis TaxID=2615203 RepID=UPI0017809A44|nr:fibronectin type III domain-containing protein [Hymenobacter baengnokdamensis]
MAFSTNATVTANSATYGQATAPTADGLWTAIGGTLNRKYYQQFTVTATTGTTLRLDSLVLSEAFYATASNTKLAIVYSKTGFTTNDSTEISGTGTLNKGALTVAASGNLTKGIAVLQNNSGPANPLNTYRLAINGAAGVTLAGGQTLSFRLYNSCGSSSNGKYVLLKNLAAVGQTATVGALGTTTAQVAFTTPAAGGYTYTISTSPAGGTASLATAPSGANGYVATYTLSGLTPGATYTATVSGTNGTAATTITSPSFTTNAGTCAGPTGLAVSSITQTSAQASFVQPTTGNTNTGYTLKYYPTLSGTPVVTQTLDAAATGASLSGLAGGTSYTVTLQSLCASGTGTLQTASFTTLSCANPTSLVVSAITASSASLSFVPGTGNTSYSIMYYPTGAPGAAISLAATASPVALSGLASGTAYTVTLQSTCANGALGDVLAKTFSTRLTSSPLLQQWPLTATASDDASVRSAGVTASSATLTPSVSTPLVLADGTSADGESAGPLPAYSSLGQGLAPNGNGSGWSSSVASATRYEEFVVTAAVGGSVRVDSLVFSSGGYGSGALLAVAYSTDAFASSTFILGSLAAPVAVGKVSSAGYSVLRLPLTGAAGVTLSAGSNIAFRLYYTIGTSSQRHVLTKNLYVTGVATPTCPGATNLSVSAVTPTKELLSFTPGSGNTAYTVTVTPQGGSPLTISPAPAASPVSLTGLSPVTTYAVTLQASCGGTAGYVQSISFTTPAANSTAIEQWPLTADNTDNASVRSYAVAASTPVLAGLTVSAGNGSPVILPYSPAYGQAFSPNTNGNGGGWSSTVSASVYEQFDLSASAGNNLRADSLVFSTALYNTSNGKLAVACSTDGFATSTFLLGSLGAPVSLPNYSNSGFGTYRIALNGGAGLAATSGQVLSFRFYYAAGTSSTGRYALLQNVYVAGEGFVNGLPNLVVGDATTVPAGTTYGNVTVVSGGIATLSGPLVAQGATTVQSGGVLNTACQTVAGSSFTLAAGGELQICDPAGISANGSTGAVQVTGTRSFSTDAIYTYTSTTTNGTNPQSGTGLPATVRTLNLALAAPADTLQLTSDVVVTANLALATGLLKTYTPRLASSQLITLASGATTLSETSTSFVLGQVKSATLYFGTDGSNSAFGGIGLRLVAHMASASSLPGNTYVLRTTGLPVYGVGTSTSIRRQYRIVPATDTGLNVDMTFGYSPQAAELNGIPVGNLQLFSRPIAGGMWVNEQGANNQGAASVTKNGLTHLSDWTLGNAANPLPVTLTSFVAGSQGANALLTWATASEQSNQGFEVQVATTAAPGFQRLGFVAGAGSSPVSHHYQYLDVEAGKQGPRYYRLKLLNQDGTATYSEVQVVQFETSGATALQVAPNPFRGDALLLTTQAATATVASLRLTDVLGRTVRTQSLAVPAGAAQLTLDGLTGLPAGLYILQLMLDGHSQQVKLLRE